MSLDHALADATNRLPEHVAPMRPITHIDLPAGDRAGTRAAQDLPARHAGSPPVGPRYPIEIAR